MTEIRATFNSYNMNTQVIVNRIYSNLLTPNIKLISGCHHTISISYEKSSTLTIDTWKVIFIAGREELEVGGV